MFFMKLFTGQHTDLEQYSKLYKPPMKATVKYYSRIPSRFGRVSFESKKLNRKHREVFAPLSFIPDKEEFNVFSVLFQFFSLTSMTGQRPSTIINHSVMQVSPLTQRKNIIIVEDWFNTYLG